jgi:hypothetical protein
MFKRIILSILIITMMIIPALARIDPAFVRTDQYGMEPAMWLALVVGIGAVIQHVCRYLDKKKKNPELTYDYGFLMTTAMSILVMCQLTLQIPVVELTAESIIAALITGLGGSEGFSKTSKIRK